MRKKDVQVIKKTEPISILEPLVIALGYELKKKETDGQLFKPKNANELGLMTEEELKTKMIMIDEELQSAAKKMQNTKNCLLEHFKKEGPTEFTRSLFSGTTIPENRVQIFSETHFDLEKQKGYIDILLKEKRKQRIMQSFSDNEIESIEIVQGPVGLQLRVKVK